ncbi:16S rRNA (cytidine(1402)-2'-O)-methyltransferase [Kordiimonas marina]|uniref:16S rRNA (cytidine(1402)-2'-O)-methyltransferase n=1 Tax=Kordiimonas marina TaxID=2872312 RepID=UPI001FF50ED2|nr:16S rRNA (cytidine(1402)-2'-O)-methyltransferase [Kordiimonas marina]MCJ9429880.1 16S rRNA (cytidine(1402)-2'-O)-methyltransferase [Kordiimonas marina]
MAEIRCDQKIVSGLYVVATPIGNLADISSRARHVLSNVDMIACEDTRLTAKLLTAYLIKKPLLPYHEHNGAHQRPKLLAAIAEGKSVALVSDAGTPLISDPGFKLVAEAQDAGHFVTSIPGPCAAITALSLAGLPTDRFLFMGFPPVKSQARQTWFTGEEHTPASLVFYESAKRLPDCLKDAYASLGPRPAAVCRELTKKFEEVRRGTLEELSAHYAEAGSPKGEVVVVIGAGEKHKSSGTTEFETEKLLKVSLEHMSVKSAAAFVAELTGERKKDIYNKALELTGARDG